MQTTNEKNAQRDANTARALAVVRCGHRPPAVTNPDRTDYNTLRRTVNIRLNCHSHASGDLCIGGVEYCQFETFIANCSASEVVLVTSASYGRARLGRCTTMDYGSLGCSADVTELLDARCSGHRYCSLDVSSLRAVLQPCPNDLTSYLDVSFRCVPGTVCRHSGCQQCVCHAAYGQSK